MPTFVQQVTYAIRDGTTLDHCYTTIRGVYRSIPRAPLGRSSHAMIYLVPTYKQQLKCVKCVCQWLHKFLRRSVFRRKPEIFTTTTNRGSIQMSNTSYRRNKKLTKETTKTNTSRRGMHRDKLEESLTTNNPRYIWQCLKAITNYKQSSLLTLLFLTI